jgi:hypothetical protein
MLWEYDRNGRIAIDNFFRREPELFQRDLGVPEGSSTPLSLLGQVTGRDLGPAGYLGSWIPPNVDQQARSRLSRRATPRKGSGLASNRVGSELFTTPGVQGGFRGAARMVSGTTLRTDNLPVQFATNSVF